MQKSVTALERSLGASLFDRSPQGLALTADGARYLERCQPLLEELADADETVGAAAAQPRGTVVVGAPAFVLRHLLGPVLPRFHARYPDIAFDFRAVNRVAEAAAIDVFVLFGWHDPLDLVQRPIAQTRYCVAASPDYWSAHGLPQRPKDLQRHECFVFRNPHGTLLDVWEFQRDKEVESATVHGWFASSLSELVLDAALAGEGVVRIADLTTNPYVRQGRLVPVLQDWIARNAPPVSVFFRPKHRRTSRVRLFVEFAADIFRKLEAERDERVPMGSGERPDWYDKNYARASRGTRVRA